MIQGHDYSVIAELCLHVLNVDWLFRLHVGQQR